MYPCGRCESSFQSSTGRYKHIKTIHDEVRHLCPICGKTLRRRSYLKIHLKHHCNPAIRVNSCNVCDIKFQNWKEKRSHIRKVHRKLTCTFCGSILSDRRYMDNHILRHIGEKPFNCKNCPKSFATKYELRRHSTRHGDDEGNLHSCNICGKKFPEMSRLKAHILRHTGEKYFKCSKCDKRFASKGDLKKHEAVHSEDKPYSCSKCYVKFGTTFNLKQHMKIHDNFSKKCPKCNTTLTSQSSYKQHLSRMHPAGGVPLRPNICAFCDKSFVVSGNLFRHIRKHIHELYEICELCGKQFVNQSYKFSHMRVHHTKEKEHKCGECGKDFVLKMHLTRHSLIHTRPQKSFPCIKCVRWYKSNDKLEEHIKVFHRYQRN